jgi:hypothetical protein
VRAAEWSRVSWPLAAVLSDFEPVKRGFIRRHEWVAEGFYADSSSFSRSVFYLHAFAIPLFVPSDHLYFTYGARVGSRWEGVTDELLAAVRASLPGLRELATLDGLRRRADRPAVDLHHAEVHLCVALIQEKAERFVTLAKAIDAWNEQLAWERPTIDRCARLAEIVRAAGQEAGIQTLRERVPGVLALFD